MHMNILVILIKNTAALDFVLPVLWKIKQKHSQANVSVLYCTLNKKKILRKSRFYSDMLNTYRIREYDFSSFLKPPYMFLKGVWGRLFSKSDRDSLSVNQKYSRFPFWKSFSSYIQYGLKWLEIFLIQRVNFQQILPSLNPDVILLDNTTSRANRVRGFIMDYLERTRKKTILLPHAPHHSSTTAFTPFNKVKQLPDYCEFWMPFKFEKTWEAVPGKESQFVYVGYPGLDAEWLAHIGANTRYGSAINMKVTSTNQPLRSLFVVRRFLEKGQKRSEGDNAFVYDFDEFSYYLDLVGSAIEKMGTDIEVIVKPHPSNDYKVLKDTLRESNICNWRVSYEPIYALLSEIDFVISLYSTVLLIPAMAGIPVMLLNSSTQSVVHQEDEFKRLYTGLRFYLKNPEDLPLRLKEVIDVALEQRNSKKIIWKGDAEHLRYFYPDGTMKRCMERLEV